MAYDKQMQSLFFYVHDFMSKNGMFWESRVDYDYSLVKEICYTCRIVSVI